MPFYLWNFYFYTHSFHRPTVIVASLLFSVIILRIVSKVEKVNCIITFFFWIFGLEVKKIIINQLSSFFCKHADYRQQVDFFSKSRTKTLLFPLWPEPKWYCVYTWKWLSCQLQSERSLCLFFYCRVKKKKKSFWYKRLTLFILSHYLNFYGEMKCLELSCLCHKKWS